MGCKEFILVTYSLYKLLGQLVQLKFCMVKLLKRSTFNCKMLQHQMSSCFASMTFYLVIFLNLRDLAFMPRQGGDLAFPKHSIWNWTKHCYLKEYVVNVLNVNYLSPPTWKPNQIMLSWKQLWIEPLILINIYLIIA